MTTEQFEFLDMLEKTLGNISIALDKTNTLRHEYEDWMEDIKFRIRVDEVKNKSIDYVENKLIQLINDGNLSAIQFYLKSKGRERGW